MNSKLIAMASAAAIAATAGAMPSNAEAHWRGGNWWVPGAVVGGLALGAAIASRPNYYGPGYSYAYSPDPYYGSYAYANGGPYYGSYADANPNYAARRYYYPEPRYYYYERPYRHWTEF